MEDERATSISSLYSFQDADYAGDEQDSDSGSSTTQSGEGNTSSGGTASQPVSYIVTFTYEGVTFATPITQNTTIEWEDLTT